MVSETDLEQARYILTQNPKAGRGTLAELLSWSDYKAREVLRTINDEPEVEPVIRYVVFDLETTDLKADAGRILCASIYRSKDGQIVSYRQDEIEDKRNMSDDRRIAELIRDELDDAHIVMGYFSKGFDVSFLNTRLAKNESDLCQRRLHFDPIWFFRGWRGLKPRSSKMSVMAEFFDLDERKPAVDVDVWKDAMVGDKEAMDELVERCEADVRITCHLARKALDLGLPKSIQVYP